MGCFGVGGYRGSSHESKVRNLKRSFELCIILMMVFWTVCMQISIAMRNLNCAIQMTVWRCFSSDASLK